MIPWNKNSWIERYMYYMPGFFFISIYDNAKMNTSVAFNIFYLVFAWPPLLWPCNIVDNTCMVLCKCFHLVLILSCLYSSLKTKDPEYQGCYLIFQPKCILCMVLKDNIYNINIIHGLVVNWHYQISTSQLHLSYN